MTKKRIAILGSTGSIGTQTLQCLRFFDDAFEVVALTCHTSRTRFKEQQNDWQPMHAVVTSEVANPEKTLAELVMRDDIDCVVNALSGVSGVSATRAALAAGKTVFLANKESLVMCGQELMALARKKRARIIPLDSEAAGLWQLLRCTHLHTEFSVVPGLCPEKIAKLRSVMITASGGPFFGCSREHLSRVTREDALAHPTWQMGKKITVDSATLVNKAFELIECAHLFELPIENIKVVVDRKSFVHAGVEYTDGSQQWVAYVPDMRSPITDAFMYAAGGNCSEAYIPELPKVVSGPAPSDFQKVDEKTFPALAVARNIFVQGDRACADFCQKNEAAVAAFLKQEIPFLHLLNRS